jgi:hypothetical protein
LSEIVTDPPFEPITSVAVFVTRNAGVADTVIVQLEPAVMPWQLLDVTAYFVL